MAEQTLLSGQDLLEIVEKTLRDHGYDPDYCTVRGYKDEHGVTWWTGDDDEGPTNYVHSDGCSEFYGAIQDPFETSISRNHAQEAKTLDPDLCYDLMAETPRVYP